MLWAVLRREQWEVKRHDLEHSLAAALHRPITINSPQCAHALSLFITSAQSATSRHKAMHVEYVLESTETSLTREPDAVVLPRMKPRPRQMIATAITIRHSRGIGRPSSNLIHPTANHVSVHAERGTLKRFLGGGLGQWPLGDTAQTALSPECEQSRNIDLSNPFGSP